MSEFKAIEAVVEGVLKEASKGRPVPSELIAAMADGRGDPDLLRQTETAIFQVPPAELVLFDADRIGDWVFDSSRPPVICGASLILNELNLNLRDEFRDRAVFSGGGEGLLLVPRGEGEKAAGRIRQKFQDESAGALSVTVATLEVWPSWFASRNATPAEEAHGLKLLEGTPALLARIRDEVRKEKDARGASSPNIPGSHERCAVCRDRAGDPQRPLSKYRDEEGPLDEGILCHPCDLRWGRGREEIGGVILEDLAAYGSLGEDTSRQSKSGYSGFLYSDGNSMGRLFADIQSLKELRKLSLAVSKVFEELNNRVGDEIPYLPSPKPQKRKFRGFLSFLGGGDEAIWILPSRFAVQIAENLPNWLREAASGKPILQDVLKDDGRDQLSVGIGLTLCDCKYPMRYQYSLAKQLQKNAKEIFYSSNNRGGSSIDFEIVTDATPRSEDLKTSRKLAYASDDPAFALTCRPCTAAEFLKLVSRVRAAVDSNFPNSQLFSLSRAASEGERVFLNYLLYQIARNLDEYKGWLSPKGGRANWLPVDPQDEAAVQDFFVRRNKGLWQGIEGSTWIADALQLKPFIAPAPKAEEEGA